MPEAVVPLWYHAIVHPDPDGLALGAGRIMAGGYRMNPDTSGVSADSRVGYGMMPSAALASRERVWRERDGWRRGGCATRSRGWGAGMETGSEGHRPHARWRVLLSDGTVRARMTSSASTGQGFTVPPAVLLVPEPPVVARVGEDRADDTVGRVVARVRSAIPGQRSRTGGQTS